MAGLADLQNLQNQLIRKTLNFSAYIAASTAATVDESTLFASPSGNLSALPAGYADLGYITDAGAKFSRSITESDVTSVQSVTPTRADMTADSTTVVIEAQETNIHTIGLYTGAAPSSLTPNPTSGVLRIDTPPTPVNRYYRLLCISVDETDAGEIVLARYFPKAKPTSFDDQSYAKGDDPNLWGVTLTGFVDSVVGTAQSYLFGGAGWKALLTDMGFAEDSSSSS